MSALDHLLTIAAEYGRAEGVELKTVSWRAFGDGKKLEAIRDKGADIQVRRLEGALAWFSTNWPEGAVWPVNVPRPILAANDPRPQERAA